MYWMVTFPEKDGTRTTVWVPYICDFVCELVGIPVDSHECQDMANWEAKGILRDLGIRVTSVPGGLLYPTRGYKWYKKPLIRKENGKYTCEPKIEKIWMEGSKQWLVLTKPS